MGGERENGRQRCREREEKEKGETGKESCLLREINGRKKERE